MKRLVMATLLLSTMVTSVDAMAQDRENSLVDGAWALQFAIIGDVFHLDEFAGGVSFKRQFSPKWALRFGVEATAGQTSSDYSNITAEETRSSYGVTASTIYQRYVNPESDANFYWGVGPIVGWSQFNIETEDDSTSSRSESHNTELGATGLLGIEWFASRVISLHAEYYGVASFRHEHHKDRSEVIGSPPYIREATYDQWRFWSSSVRFGLSAYF